MSCITLERGSHRWPLHPLQDAPALPPPSETATRSLASAPRTNATVSVLLGQNWKALPATERAVYVEAAKKIKEDFKAEHPEWGLGEIGKACGALWKEMGAEAKETWDGKAREDKARYEREMAAYTEAGAAAGAAADADAVPAAEQAVKAEAGVGEGA